MIPKDLDLALVILFTLLCIPFVVIPPLNEISAVRIILGLPLVLFLPGYSLIATLFPRKDDLGGIERVALSFGLSIAVVPLLGLALNYTPFGIRLSPILGVLSVFTVSLAIGAYIRRSSISEAERFVVENFFPKNLNKTSDIRFAQSDTKIDKILTIILIISIVLAVSMTVYVIAMPKEGEKFTEFYVLGPNGTADNYPTDLRVGEEGEVIIGIVNHEYANVTYQLEVKLNGTVIGKENADLKHNETWERPLRLKRRKKEKNKSWSSYCIKTLLIKALLRRKRFAEMYIAHFICGWI